MEKKLKIWGNSDYRVTGGKSDQNHTMRNYIKI